MPPKTLSNCLYRNRLSESKYPRADACAEFLSDHSRIAFSSSFRRLVKKAQVFSLESNTSVRNRLTHSLEVADVGRTIARSVGLGLQKQKRIAAAEIPCMISIVENACLMHDIGNPPFGHFGESAIQRWFTNLDNHDLILPAKLSEDDLYDQINFDGNPQGFRIATRLHFERDEHSLNLTCGTLLASMKYPHSRRPDGGNFSKKIGLFGSEKDLYEKICKMTGHTAGERYFLAYLMELADDCCYCLSDIADSFEKKVVSLEQYTNAVTDLCKEAGLDSKPLACLTCADDFDFRFNVAIPLTKDVIAQSTKYFVENFDSFLNGTAPEISDSILAGKYLKCLKKFARRNIYTSLEVERIELSGFHVVTSLLNQFGKLLVLRRIDFESFVEGGENHKRGELDFEWRLFNRLSKRMLKAYKFSAKDLENDDLGDKQELVARARLLVDFISGMTDESAKELHQILTGTDSMIAQTAW